MTDQESLREWAEEEAENIAGMFCTGNQKAFELCTQHIERVIFEAHAKGVNDGRKQRE